MRGRGYELRTSGHGFVGSASDKVLARCEYKNGLRYRLLIDTNGDGRFDEEETYSPFGLVEKTRKIP